LTLHKFHSFLVLEALGVRVPRTWQYRADHGWVGSAPPAGLRVIAKSTFEASSVGVTDASVFEVSDDDGVRLRALAESIGQPVTVQEFIAGTEICVPVISRNNPIIGPPVEAVITRATGSPEAVMTIDDALRPDGYSHREFSGPLALTEALGTTALRVFEMLELRGLARCDFRVDAAGVPWLFDVAVEPGIGARGSAFRSLSMLGLDYPGFLRVMLAASLSDRGLLEPGS
jgi:D-alanine-D-alanine ligase